MRRRPPSTTQSRTLFTYTTLFRSVEMEDSAVKDIHCDESLQKTKSKDTRPVEESDNVTAQDGSIKDVTTESVEGKTDNVRDEHGGTDESIDDDKNLQDAAEDGMESRSQSVERQDTELRRSTRHREPPDRLTYKSLGNPLILVMHSILDGLEKAFTKALEVEDAPDIRQYTLSSPEVV